MVRGSAHVHAFVPSAGRWMPALLLSLASGGAALAQSPAERSSREPATVVLVVPALRGADSALRVSASQSLVQRLDLGGPSRSLRVVPLRDARAYLVSSGYPVHEPLSAHDARALARYVRADAIVSGEARRDRTGYRIDLTLALAGNQNAEEQLETGTGASIERAAARAATALRTALEQVPAERRCRELLTGGRAADAARVANDAAAARPSAVLLRHCLLRALDVAGAPADSVIRVANDILARDPVNVTALAYAAAAAQRGGDGARASEYGTRLQVADENCAAPAGAGGLEKAPDAVQVLDSLVSIRPASIGCRDLQLRALLAGREWRRAAAAADTLAQLDSSYASEPFYRILTGLMVSDSQPALAAEVMGRVTARKPQSVGMWLLYAQMLHQAREMRPAIAAARRALELDSAESRAWLRMAAVHADLAQPDSILALARMAAPRVDSVGKEGFAQFLLNQGSRLVVAGQQAKFRSGLTTALPHLHLADTLAGEGSLRHRARLMIGTASLIMGQLHIQDAAAQRSCAMAREAEGDLNVAQLMLPFGSRVDPAAAGQRMQAAMQLSDYTARVVAAVCRKARDE